MAKYLNLRFAYLFPILYIGRLNGAINATIVIQRLLYRWTRFCQFPLGEGFLTLIMLHKLTQSL